MLYVSVFYQSMPVCKQPIKWSCVSLLVAYFKLLPKETAQFRVVSVPVGREAPSDSLERGRRGWWECGGQRNKPKTGSLPV